MSIIAIYLVIGLLGAILNYMELAPLVSKREHLTFWPLNILAWPIVMTISFAMWLLKRQQNK